MFYRCFSPPAANNILCQEHGNQIYQTLILDVSDDHVDLFHMKIFPIQKFIPFTSFKLLSI